MAATPYVGRIVFKKMDGTMQSEAVYGPDVNADYVQWESMGRMDFVRTQADCYITDISLSAAGVDCSQLQLFINGKDTGIRLIGGGLIATVNNRIQDPIGKIPAGSIVMFKELT